MNEIDITFLPRALKGMVAGTWAITAAAAGAAAYWIL